MHGSKPRAKNPAHARTISVSTSASGARNERKMAMITVELKPEEIHAVLRWLRCGLEDAVRRGDSAADMKALLARIEYLEGLK